MDATTLRRPDDARPILRVTDVHRGRIVTAVEFRKLLISHRRMIRADRHTDRLRGLKDLDTGELFLTDERRLLEAAR